MATSIWDVATEGASSFNNYGYRPDIELSYEDRAAIDVATESDTGFVDYIDQCAMSLLDTQNRVFAQESISAIQVAKGMDIAAAMEGLKSTLRDAWEAIKAFLQKVWETIKEYVKKAKDWLARRASLGKAMLTKYSSVLRNKKVSANLEFDWCEVRITELVKLREGALKAAFICANAGELEDLQDTVAKIEKGLQASQDQRKVLGSLDRTMMDRKKDGALRRNAYDELIKQAPKELRDNIDRDTNFNGPHPYQGWLNGHIDISDRRVNTLYKEWVKKERENFKKLYNELRILKYAYSTQQLTELMNRTVYGNIKGPQHNKVKWDTIKNEVMQWADMDTGRYFTEALGIFEKDADSFNKIIKEFEKNRLDDIDEQYKGATGAMKQAESAARKVVTKMTSSASKVHKMYIMKLKDAISLMQTQAIAAARKAILDKGTTTNESYIFNDMDVIY